MIIAAKRRLPKDQRSKEGNEGRGRKAPKQRFTPPSLDFLQQLGPPGYVAGSLRNDRGFSLRPEAVPISATDHHANTPEDAEADAIYDEVERSLRRKPGKKRSADQEDDGATANLIDPSLQVHLKQVSTEEWLNLPEVGDFRRKRLKKLGNLQDPRVKERFLPLPDNLLTAAGESSAYTSLEGDGHDDADGSVDGAGEDTLLKAGLEREAALQLTLDSVAQTLQQSRDFVRPPELPQHEDAESILDDESYQRSRKLLRRIIRHHQREHGDGANEDDDLASVYVALARLEERQGKRRAALCVLREAVGRCPGDADVWLNGIRISSSSKPCVEAGEWTRADWLQRALASPAGDSDERLWLESAAAVGPGRGRSHWLDALARFPASRPLWDRCIDGAGADEVLATLRAAVQAMRAPVDRTHFQHQLVERLLSSTDPLVASTENASLLTTQHKQFLQEAQHVLNTVATSDPYTLVLASEVLERMGDDRLVDMLNRLPADSLTTANALGWLERCEQRASQRTAVHIVDRLLAASGEDGGSLLSQLIARKCWWSAAHVYGQQRPEHASADWRDFLQWGSEHVDARWLNDLYRVNPSTETLRRVIDAGVAEHDLWLSFLAHVPDEQREEHLRRALAAYPDSAQLAAMLARAAGSALSPAEWDERIEQARAQGDLAGVEALWLARLDSLGAQDGSARTETVKRALKECPQSGALWIQLSQAAPSISQRRAVLEQARHRLAHGSASLGAVWRESLQLEKSAGNSVGLAQLLQRCPVATVAAEFGRR